MCTGNIYHSSITDKALVRQSTENDDNDKKDDKVLCGVSGRIVCACV